MEALAIHGYQTARILTMDMAQSAVRPAIAPRAPLRQPYDLLDLPAEIRNRIWCYALTDTGGAIVLYINGPTARPGPTRYSRRRRTETQRGPFALTLLCWQIRREALMMVFSESRFYFKQSRLPVRFIGGPDMNKIMTISENRLLHNVRRLRVDWDFFQHETFQPQGFTTMVNLLELDLHTTSLYFAVGSDWLKNNVPRLEKIGIHYNRLFAEFREWEYEEDTIDVKQFEPGCTGLCALLRVRWLSRDEWDNMLRWKRIFDVYDRHKRKFEEHVQRFRPISGIIVHPRQCTHVAHIPDNKSASERDQERLRKIQ